MNYIVKQSDSDVIESILKNRNITNEQVDSWLEANSSHWESPDNYPNMKEAFECLMFHIENHDDIYVIVDPDGDGVLSSGILINFIIKYLNHENVFYLLHNGKQHGIENSMLNKCIEDKIKLLLVPDAGSNDIRQMEKLIENGIDVIVTDHHEYNYSNIPTGAWVINNQHPDVVNRYGSGTLVTYKFIFYVAEQLGIDLGYDYLTQCYIANVTDMMSLNTDVLENRYIYKLGCWAENCNNKLIKSFLKDLKKKNKITVEDISFGMSPKINSILRLGSVDEKEMLIESSIGLSDEEVKYTYKGKVKKQSIYEAVVRIGNRLKGTQKREVEKFIDKGLEILSGDDDRILIINGAEIKRELRGLLANKLLGIYQCPVLILSGNERLSGSARGIGDIDFKDMCLASGYINYAEGHSNSFGIGICRNNIENFIGYMNKRLIGLDLSNKTEIDYEYKNNIPLEDLLDISDLDDIWTFDVKRPKLLIRDIKINTTDITKKGIDMSFKIGDIIYRRDYCSRAFYEDLICLEDNGFYNADLSMDLIVEVKKTERGFVYLNIVDYESSVIE